MVQPAASPLGPIFEGWEWIKPVMALRDPDVPLRAAAILDSGAHDLLERLEQALQLPDRKKVIELLGALEVWIFLPPLPSPQVAVRYRTPAHRCYQAVELGLHAIAAWIRIGEIERAHHLAEKLALQHALGHEPGPNRLAINLALQQAAGGAGDAVQAECAESNALDCYLAEINNRADYDRSRMFTQYGAALFQPVQAPRAQAQPAVLQASGARHGPGPQPGAPIPGMEPHSPVGSGSPGAAVPVMGTSVPAPVARAASTKAAVQTSAPAAVRQTPADLGGTVGALGIAADGPWAPAAARNTQPASGGPEIPASVEGATTAALPAPLVWTVSLATTSTGIAITHTMKIKQVWIHDWPYEFLSLDGRITIRYLVTNTYCVARLARSLKRKVDAERKDLMLVDTSTRPAADQAAVFRLFGRDDPRFARLYRPSSSKNIWRLFNRLLASLAWGTGAARLSPLSHASVPYAALRLPMKAPARPEVVGPLSPSPINRPLAVACMEASELLIDTGAYRVKPLRGRNYYTLERGGSYFLLQVKCSLDRAGIDAGDYLLIKQDTVPGDGDDVVTATSAFSLVVADGDAALAAALGAALVEDLEGGYLLLQYLLTDGLVELRSNRSDLKRPSHYCTPMEAQKNIKKQKLISGVVVACFTPLKPAAA